MLRTILAVLGGVVAGVLSVAAIELLGHVLFPLPEGLEVDPADVESIRAVMDEIPALNLFAVVVAWFSGAFMAGWVAGLIAREARLLAGLAAGAAILAAVIFNLTMMPHPVWMWWMGVVLPMPFAWLGVLMSGRR